MKKRLFFTTLVLLAAYLLSACSGTPQPAGGAPAGQTTTKVQAAEVAFTGVVEAINGNEWTINGQVLSVDPGVVRNGPFQAGDTVKIEGTVNADGSLTVSRVEAPSAADLADLPQLGNENGNDNSNDANENANSNDDNSNDTNANDNTNDGNANEDNSNDDNSNDANDNSNDDNSNDNSNEDGGNTNDDSGNSNDDGDSGGNSNDDGGGDDGGQDGGGNSNED